MRLHPVAEQLESPRRQGGTYLAGVPWRAVFHTTEVIPADVGRARSMAERHEYPPHLWAWPEKDWVGQTVPFDRSAFALKHPAGTPETNKARALQVEVIGLAASTPDWPEEWWAWLGRRVLRPILDLGYPINLDNVAPTTGQDGYGLSGAVRMSRAEWARFDGVCGHANVPDNTHWDIGAGRLDLVARSARRPASETPQELLDMFTPQDAARLKRVAQALGVEAELGGISRNGAARIDVTYQGVKALLARQNVNLDLAVDEAEIARLVLEGLDPAAMVAAIPTTIAEDVLDLLVKRLERPQA